MLHSRTNKIVTQKRQLLNLFRKSIIKTIKTLVHFTIKMFWALTLRKRHELYLKGVHHLWTHWTSSKILAIDIMKLINLFLRKILDILLVLFAHIILRHYFFIKIFYIKIRLLKTLNIYCILYFLCNANWFIIKRL